MGQLMFLSLNRFQKGAWPRQVTEITTSVSLGIIYLFRDYSWSIISLISGSKKSVQWYNGASTKSGLVSLVIRFPFSVTFYYIVQRMQRSGSSLQVFSRSYSENQRSTNFIGCDCSCPLITYCGGVVVGLVETRRGSRYAPASSLSVSR